MSSGSCVMNLCILGYGAFGTSLAHLWSRKFEKIFIWKFSKEYNGDLESDKYIIRSDIDSAIKEANVVVVSTASVGIDYVANEIKKSENNSGKYYLLTSKGINPKTLQTMSQIFGFANPYLDTAVFSGPTFAKEIMKDLPIWAVIASKNKDLSNKLVDILMVPGKLSLKTSENPVGIEIVAALKNVAAIIAGIVDSFELGDSAKGAILANVFYEIFQIALSSGASYSDIFGVAGIGDMISSCCGRYSRNYRAGLLLGQGKSVEDIVISIGEVSEGIKTTESTYLLSNKLSLNSYIISGLYNVIYDGLDVRKFVHNIVSR